MRENGWAEDAIHRWIRGRLHHPTDEDLRGWDPEDVAEYRAILNGERYEPPVPKAEASGQTVIIHNHYNTASVAAPASVPGRTASGAPVSRVERQELDEERDFDLVISDEPEEDVAATPEPQETVMAPEGKTPIPDLVETIIESDRRRNRVNEATSRGFRTSIALFSEITGVIDAGDITQSRIEDFCAALERLPPDYRRGAVGRATPIWDIIEKAEKDGVETGLSAKTVNKQLEAIQKLIRHARAHGVNMPGIEISILRVRDEEAASEKRVPFTTDDILEIFKQPGLSLSCERDALFWNAHVAAYTGARREEIAGLDRDDIEERDGVPVIAIRSNEHRKLKNGQSARIIPIHKDLIEIGLVEYAKKRPAGLLWDVKRKGNTFGNDFEYAWQKVKKSVIKEGEKKAFHSFRHSAIQTLIDAGIPLAVRAALFGHDPGHIEGKIYGGEMKTSVLLDAVNLLPSVR